MFTEMVLLLLFGVEDWTEGFHLDSIAIQCWIVQLRDLEVHFTVNIFMPPHMCFSTTRYDVVQFQQREDLPLPIDVGSLSRCDIIESVPASHILLSAIF